MIIPGRKREGLWTKYHDHHLFFGGERKGKGGLDYYRDGMEWWA